MFYSASSIVRAGLALVVLACISSGAWAQPTQNPTNGHWYAVVNCNLRSPSGCTWDFAKTDAESQMYNGMSGYLATLTSPGRRSGRGSAAGRTLPVRSLTADGIGSLVRPGSIRTGTRPASPTIPAGTRSVPSGGPRPAHGMTYRARPIGGTTLSSSAQKARPARLSLSTSTSTMAIRPKYA